ncbi:MAG: DNA topoisomerase IV subunit A, partial [Gammaproteobacteria bacterium]|nr:DNA topoisomerase IV subunit A [Gammaproteobacteria bacterium]
AAIFFDSHGRAFAIPAHSLPSARSQGEALTSRIKSQAGGFDAVTMGGDEQRVFLASDAGYGFIAKLVDLQTKNKSGKAVLKVPEGGHVLAICQVNDIKNQQLVVATNMGRLLLFPISELPELAKGKGNKIIAIPTTKYKAKEEWVVGVAVLAEKDKLILFSGKRKLTLKQKDLTHYIGSRAQRGSKLPRGYQQVSSIAVEI